MMAFGTQIQYGPYEDLQVAGSLLSRRATAQYCCNTTSIAATVRVLLQQYEYCCNRTAVTVRGLLHLQKYEDFCYLQHWHE